MLRRDNYLSALSGIALVIKYRNQLTVRVQNTMLFSGTECDVRQRLCVNDHQSRNAQLHEKKTTNMFVAL